MKSEKYYKIKYTIVLLFCLIIVAFSLYFNEDLTECIETVNYHVWVCNITIYNILIILFGLLVFGLLISSYFENKYFEVK